MTRLTEVEREALNDIFSSVASTKNSSITKLLIDLSSTIKSIFNKFFSK